MRRIKELNVSNRRIFKSFGENKFNLIITPRKWGLTSLLINYVNRLPKDKKIFFNVAHFTSIRSIKEKITHPNCQVKTVTETSLIGYKYDYIICDNFFQDEWIKKITLLWPTMVPDGKMIVGDTNIEYLRDGHAQFFNRYNKIIIR